ncbi:MAG: glycosyltransferase family 2 protein [Magnetospirillum sp.]|nr:glycosyltransferase family 2 protein [Magnetospirillum sp.]
MSVVIALAAYNEAKNIGPVIRRLVELGYECVVVDDGSADDTFATAEAAGARVARHHSNLGQGHAILTGFMLALLDPQCEIIVTMDSDGQHAPEEIVLFLDKMKETGADMVVGSRVLGRPAERNHALRRWFAPLYTQILNRASGYELSDALTGFRAFRRSSVEREMAMLGQMLEPQYLTAELLIRLGRRGFKVDEVAVNIRSRVHGVSTKGLLRMGFGILRAVFRTLIDNRS